jgi:hypothetical protein
MPEARFFYMELDFLHGDREGLAFQDLCPAA